MPGGDARPSDSMRGARLRTVFANQGKRYELGAPPIGISAATVGCGSPASRKVFVRCLPKSGAKPESRKTSAMRLAQWSHAGQAGWLAFFELKSISWNA